MASAPKKPLPTVRQLLLRVWTVVAGSPKTSATIVLGLFLLILSLPLVYVRWLGHSLSSDSYFNMKLSDEAPRRNQGWIADAIQPTCGLPILNIFCGILSDRPRSPILASVDSNLGTMKDFAKLKSDVEKLSITVSDRINTLERRFRDTFVNVDSIFRQRIQVNSAQLSNLDRPALELVFLANAAQQVSIRVDGVFTTVSTVPAVNGQCNNLNYQYAADRGCVRQLTLPIAKDQIKLTNIRGAEKNQLAIHRVESETDIGPLLRYNEEEEEKLINVIHRLSVSIVSFVDQANENLILGPGEGFDLDFLIIVRNRDPIEG